MRLPIPEQSRVILIGSAEYAEPKLLSDIPEVERNLDDLRAVLTHPRRGIVPLDRCDVELNPRELPAIGRRLKAATADVTDTLIVYFAGHGIVGARHELYLAMHHTDPDNPSFSSLPYEFLRNAVLDCPATTKILIIDSCFSGLAVGNSMSDATALLGKLDVSGTYVLTSAHRDQVSLVLPGESHTSFTGRLLRLLQRGVPGDAEFITIEDAYKHLVVEMGGEGLSRPQRRASATADLIALARNPLYAETLAAVLQQRYQDATQQALQGLWGSAGAELEDVLRQQIEHLGADHADALRTEQFLAHIEGASGSPGRAERILRDLLARQIAVQGADHEDALQSRQLLAVSLAENGRTGEAVAVLRALVPDRRRALGSHHVASLRSQHVLARILAVAGETEEAVALMKELLTTREHQLGPDHPETVMTRNDLALILDGTSVEVALSAD